MTEPFLTTRYPTTPTLSVDAVHDRPTWEDVTLVVAGVPGGLGGVVSAWVVADAWLLGGETLPAPSEALTV